MNTTLGGTQHGGKNNVLSKLGYIWSRNVPGVGYIIYIIHNCINQAVIFY